MANICNNIMKVYFQGTEEEQLKNCNAFVEEFLEEFGTIEYIYPEDREEEFDGNLEMNFDSKWSTPEEKLETYSKKYNCTFLGVSYEWGNGYVNSFEIDMTQQEMNKITGECGMVDDAPYLRGREPEQ